ncbi:MAG TPA: glycosyltransferase [Rectinemataceae bacterium]|nr:glycosyltransferase [Rectinemataceae bacterium]
MRVALVALAFHLENTKSSLFFINVLRSAFDDFHVVADGDAWYEIPRLKPDLLIVYQRLFSPEELECFGTRNVVLVPMYDACPHTEEFWNRYRAYKVLCFSRTLHEFLEGRSFRSHHVRYFSAPPSALPAPPREKGLRIFFWERSRLIDWACVRALLGESKVEAFHYHRSSNIESGLGELPGEQDVERYHIVFSDWFDSRASYIEALASCTVYIAPRESEGIGLSFIEALAMGLCVVAPNAPTMNEYIEDGVNGILYDPALPKPLSFFGAEAMGKKAADLGKKAHEAWLAALPEMLRFFEEPLPTYRPRRHFALYLAKRGRSIVRHHYKKTRSLWTTLAGREGPRRRRDR